MQSFSLTLKINVKVNLIPEIPEHIIGLLEVNLDQFLLNKTINSIGLITYFIHLSEQD